MKKVFLVIAAVCISMAASAQILIGGNLGYGTTSNAGRVNSSDWSDVGRTNKFEIAPKFGFQLNDRMSFGLMFGYSFSNKVSYTTDPDDFDLDLDGLLKFTGKTMVSSGAWKLAPYFRYAVANFGKCSFFVEASVPFAWGLPSTTRGNYRYSILGGEPHEYKSDPKTSPVRSFSWGITVTPGFSYKMGEHCSMDLYVDVFSIAFHQDNVITEVGSTKSVARNSSFNIGINSLPESQLFRLGFNYAF